MQKLEPKIIPIETLLNTETTGKLVIPEYQRPYKWTIKHVNQLINDILFFKDKAAYRLGTVVLHQKPNDENFNIVDGQQRTITLLLIAIAIQESKKTELEACYLQVDNQIAIAKQEFTNDTTRYNIQNNYYEIKRRIKDFDEEIIRFFFEKCQVVKIVLDDITEAFQFFDSQNTRGKDLDPHDLLKAFHLREMSHLSEEEKKDSVNKWESMLSDELSDLFGQYLYRIRNWGKGRSARYFTKNDIAVFKGVNPDNKIEPYPRDYHLAHHYVDNYNNSKHRSIDLQTITYPFQLDQVILNGKRFFEMVAYYKNIIKTKIKSKNIESPIVDIVEILEDYEGKGRTGDRYVRNLFDCALLYYIDKFGEKDISQAIKIIFVWSYSLRLNLKSVQMASIDKHARGIRGTPGDTPLFKIIREAISHKEVTNLELKTLQENQSSKTDKIEAKFKELGY